MAGNPNKKIKDFYVVPLASHSKIPRTLLPFDGPGLEDNRPHMLIGIMVRAKPKHGDDDHKSSSHSSSSSNNKHSISSSSSKHSSSSSSKSKHSSSSSSSKSSSHSRDPRNRDPRNRDPRQRDPRLAKLEKNKEPSVSPHVMSLSMWMDHHFMCVTYLLIDTY